MFTTKPEAQAKKLTDALDAIVCNCEAPEENTALLAELGRRHVGYGANPEHYDLVIDLMIESMKDLLGSSASAPDLHEWRTALRLVSDRMIAASGDPESRHILP